MVYEGCFISDFIVSEKKRMKNEKLLNMKKFLMRVVYTVCPRTRYHTLLNFFIVDFSRKKYSL